MLHRCYRLAQRKPGRRSAPNYTHTHIQKHTDASFFPPQQQTTSRTSQNGACRLRALHILSVLEPAKCHFQVPDWSWEHMEPRSQFKDFFFSFCMEIQPLRHEKKYTKTLHFCLLSRAFLIISRSLRNS